MESPRPAAGPGDEEGCPATGILQSLRQQLDRVASEIRELSQKTERLASLLPEKEREPLRQAALPKSDIPSLPEVLPLPAASSCAALTTPGSVARASFGQKTAASSLSMPAVRLKHGTVPAFSDNFASQSFDGDLGRRSESLPATRFGKMQTNGKRITRFSKFMAIPSSKIAIPDRTPRGRVFADAATHISAMQAELMTGESEDASDYYYEAGFFATMVRSHAFHGLSFFMVVFSSVWMAIEIDSNDESALHMVMGHVLCSYFFLELLAQFLALRDKRDVVQDMAFVFDALLVFLVVLETWMIPLVHAAAGSESGGGGSMRIALIFRLLRFLKVLRLGKVLRQLPELLIIVRGVLMAYKAISFTILLLAIIVYAGGLVFRVLLDGTALGTENFGTVPMAMGTLLVEATLSGSRGSNILKKAYLEHPVYALLMLFYVVLANITMMGVLGGLLVQAVKTVTEFEKAHIDFVELLRDLNEIWRLALEDDKNGDNCISLDEFEEIIKNEYTVEKLKHADVDVESLAMCGSFIFQQHGSNDSLTREQFMQCVLDHRGKQTAKVKDHVQTRRYLHSQLEAMMQVQARLPPVQKSGDGKRNPPSLLS